MMFLAATIAAGCAMGVPDTAPTKHYTLVIGENRPAKAGQHPLRYADDDAARFYTMFRALPGEAALFALFDPDTQRLFPETVGAAEVPSKERLVARATQFFQLMREDAARGISTEFYLVYSGHGYVDAHGEGHLGLGEETLSRRELYEHFLARSPATMNHVIVDACDAFYFVQARGDPDLERRLQQRADEFIERQSLARFPNTGAILATASAAESHEWSEIQAGVFSHEVRSALLGAADANDDDTVTYQELEAFILAADAGVHHAKSARAIFVQPPSQHRKHPVLSLRDMASAQTLRVGAESSGRITVADDIGRRYLDLNKAPGFALTLRLIAGVSYFVRMGELDYRVPSQASQVELASLVGHQPSILSRGADLSDAYSKGLFAQPFGPQFVDGFSLGLARPIWVAAEPEREHPLRIAGIATGGAALLAAGATAALAIVGDRAYERYELASRDGSSRAAVASYEDEARVLDGRTNLALGTAIAFGLTAGTLFLLDALEVSF